MNNSYQNQSSRVEKILQMFEMINENKKVEEEEKIYETIKEACINGDINTIKKYFFSQNNNNDTNNNFGINKIFQYEVMNDYGRSFYKQGSLLHISCIKGNLEITKLLCSHPNTNLNQRNNFGMTPFYEACDNNQLDIIQLLCEIPEVDINLEEVYNRWSPLYSACCYDKIEVIKCLLKQNRIEINKQNKHGNSPLHISCLNGYLQTVKLLCEENNNNNKIDINLGNDEGQTPFYVACKGSLEIVKYLFLKYQINNNDNNFYENQITNEGFSPLYMSCYYGNYEIVKFLLENDINIEK